MDNVEKIKDRLGVEEVIGSYIKLEKSGSNLRACCPFHNEKTPSFFVSPNRGTYKCFGCGEGGDIFSFVEKFEGVDFKGALKILAEKAGIDLEKEDPKVIDERKRLYNILERATVYFERNLQKNQSAIEYLKKRGVTGQTIERFRLGFVGEGWQDLYNFLKKENYTDKEMEQAGLIKKKDKGSGFYDRFRSRIIFPLFDNSNQPVAFSGRLFEKSNKSEFVTAKYLNSPETMLFNKSSILYGYNFAKKKIRKNNFSILVEGQMDLVICHQAGYDNTVASSGTALTKEHLILLKRLSDRLVIAFDGDEAGFLSASKATKLALAEGLEVKLMSFPEGLDPADFILTNKLGWQKALKEAKHIVNFYVDKLLAEIKDKHKLGKAVEEKVLPFIALIRSEIEKANFVEELANKLEIPAKVIWEDLEKIKIEALKDLSQIKITGSIAGSLSPKNDKNRKQKILRQISGLYWWQKGLGKPIIDLDKLRKDIESTVGVEILEKIEKLNDSIKDEIIFEVEILYNEVEDIKEKVEELLRNLKIELIEEKLREVVQRQKIAEKAGDNEKILENLKMYNELSKQKSKIIN